MNNTISNGKQLENNTLIRNSIVISISDRFSGLMGGINTQVDSFIDELNLVA